MHSVGAKPDLSAKPLGYEGVQFYTDHVHNLKPERHLCIARMKRSVLCEAPAV